ncbi:MAG: S8 family serine peptidase [Candidatus Thorarchaeota archaeon]
MNKKSVRSRVLASQSYALVGAIMLVIIIPLCVNLPSVQAFTPNDPVGDPWHLESIKIHSVWDYGYSFQSAEAVGLCVIGEAIIDDQNGDLNVTEKGSFAWNADYTSYLPYPSIETGSHEGAVASVAASAINNGIGVAGIVNAPLYSAWIWSVYPDDTVFGYRMYVQQMIDTFDWGASFGKMVFTMSFLATVYQLEDDDTKLVELRNKVSDLYESGQALFFAGVDNILCPLHPKDVPQSLPYVRAIGRFDRSGSFLEGGYGASLFLVAPTGVPAYMQVTNSYGTFGGSSCATPIAASAAVLLWNQFPWATNAQIEDALCWGATDLLETGWDEKSGYGALNVEKAREYLTEYVPSANSYRLNRSAIVTSTSSNTDTTNNTDSSLPLVPIYVGISIPIIASLIVFTISIKRKRT